MLDMSLMIPEQKPDYKTTNQENKMNMKKFMQIFISAPNG